MIKINDNYLNLQDGYLFSNIRKRVDAFTAANPDKKIIRLGIGDVTLPLSPSVIKAMHSAVDDMANADTFKGYGPDYGYEFLLKAISENKYKVRGVDINIDEIFLSDGAKSDCGNIGDIFSNANVVAITDPVYPVYLDTNIMAGREIKLIPCTLENGFVPQIPDYKADIIYLCSPNNPTGAVMSRADLTKWVEYARANKAIILFDAAYEAYITEDDKPRSIFEIPGAKECAIEFCSFSKTAGFTGTRCAFTVVPKELMAYNSNGEKSSVNKLWGRRVSTKFNGVPYIVQKGAAAIFTNEGKVETTEGIAYYMENAKIIRQGLEAVGLKATGGINAPYIWLKTPGEMSSWEFFDYLLEKANVVGTPGAGFGSMGEGFFRLTAFGTRENTIAAIEHIKNSL